MLDNKVTLLSVTRIAVAFLLTACLGLSAPSQAQFFKNLFKSSGPINSRELLKQSERPMVEEANRLNSLQAKKLGISRKLHTGDQFTNLLEGSVRKILTRLKDDPLLKVVILGRDFTPVYDALRTVLVASGDPGKLLDRVKLMNISRKASAAGASDVLNYLKSHGVDGDELKCGQSHVHFYDTGYSGTVMRNILEALLTVGDDAVAKSGVAHSFRGYLLTSKLDSNYSELLTGLDRGQEAAPQNVSFDEIFTSSELSSLGLPQTKSDRFTWQVSDVEHIPHWFGPATGISGDKLIYAENASQKDKRSTLLRQRAIYKYFSHPEKLASLREFLGGGESAMAVPKLVAPPGYTLLQGNYVSGAHGVDPIVKRDSDGVEFVWKLPPNDDLIHRETFQNEIERAQQWRKARASTIDVFWDGEVKGILKTYVKGPSLEQLVADGQFLDNKDAKKRLRRLIKKLIKKRAYISDLNPSDLIFDGNRWQVVESGQVKTLKTQQEVQKKYSEMLLPKWREKTDDEEVINFFEKLFHKQWKFLQTE